MRCAKRNMRRFWYCLYKSDRIPGDTSIAGDSLAGASVVGDSEQNTDYIIDEYGNETGETVRHYARAVEMYANISPATGQSQVEQFGNLDNYDKVIVTDDMNCPIDEHSVLFIDKQPEYSTDSLPIYNYIVKRIAKSLNSISIAVRKVDVS